MKSSRSKKIALISALLMCIGLICINLGLFGLLPMFVVVISFFMTLIHGYMHLSGKGNSDAFQVSEETAKIKATALTKGLDSEKSDK